MNRGCCVRAIILPRRRAVARVCTNWAKNLPPLMVVNLQGRTFMEAIDCPFAVAETLVAKAPPEAVIVVDMHAEATSEKRALAHLLRGRVQAVVGTHTHCSNQ